MIGWLVNDCLTCIPGTKTFWHDLLDWFPGLIDMTIKSQGFKGLAELIEQQAAINGEPDFIIRNASYFRRLNLKTKTISYLQDCLTGNDRVQQLDVCNNSDIVVCNSQFVKNQYEKEIKSRIEIIQIGTDFDLFHPILEKEKLRQKFGILENSILFIGSMHPIKGFAKIQHLINNTKYNLCLVMKDGFKSNNHRVKVFNRITHEEIVEIINCCSMLICSSVTETLHLAGIEAMACDLPVLTTDVGIYCGFEDGPWGIKVKNDDFLSGVKDMFENLGSFSPRKFALSHELDRPACKKRWQDLLGEGNEKDRS